MGLKIANGATEYVKFKYGDPQRREFKGSEQISHKVSHYGAGGWADAYLDASPKLQEALDAAGAGVDATMAIGRTGEGTSTRWTVSLYEHGPNYSPGFDIQGGAPQAAAAPPSVPPNGAPPPAGNNAPPQAGGPPAAPQAAAPAIAPAGGADLTTIAANLLACKMYVEHYFPDDMPADLVQKYAATLFIEGNRKGADFGAAKTKIANGFAAAPPDPVETVAQTFDAELVGGPPPPQAPPTGPTAAADDDLPF